MVNRFPVLLFAFLLLAVSACSGPKARQRKTDGRAAAEKEIAAGTPSLLFIGLPGLDHSPLDEEIGLLQYSMGCGVDDESTAFLEAHNHAILDALREGRLAGMTYEKQALTAEAARAPFADGGGTALLLDGEEVAAPGGAHRVLLAPRFGKEGGTPYVHAVAADTGDRKELIYVSGPQARIAFAHEGRTLLVRDDGYRTIRTFDLLRGLDLQVFPDER